MVMSGSVMLLEVLIGIMCREKRHVHNTATEGMTLFVTVLLQLYGTIIIKAACSDA